MFQELLDQALVEIARGHEEELCRVTVTLRTEIASLASQLARLQVQLSSASQLPSADAQPKPPPRLDMPNPAPPGPPPEVTEQGSPGDGTATCQRQQGDQSPGREQKQQKQQQKQQQQEQQQQQRELQGPACQGRGEAEVEPHGNQEVGLPGIVDHDGTMALEALANSLAAECNRKHTADTFVLPVPAGARSQQPPESQEPPNIPMHAMSSASSASEAEQEHPSEKSELQRHGSKSKSSVGLTLASRDDELARVQLQLVWAPAAALKGASSMASVQRMSIDSLGSSKSRTLRGRGGSPDNVVPHAEEMSCYWRGLNSLAMNPASNKRVAFEVFGLLLIFYDLVWWPAQVFGYTSVPLTRAILWLSSTFWACDLLVSFFLGFTIQDQGLIEMRVSKIARHYAMTWLPIDLLLVLLDWTLNALLLLSDHGIADFGSGVFLEKVQYLRLLRLLRLLKATNIIRILSDRIQSETMRILVRVLKLLVFIMLINHLIACSWYAVGISDLEREDTWVKANDLKGKGTVYAYTTALHWSITQFTPASMEVVPMNELERSFTIVVIVSAMVIFSSFISTITNAMTQLRNLNSERNAELVKLRCYFSDHKVSASLVARISDCIHQSNKLTGSRVHSEDVSILELLPVSLKCDLAEEVFAPTLCAHPFILTWGDYYPKESKRLFLAARSSSLGAKDELFNTGQVAESMYFLSSGAMVYITDGKRPTRVNPGQWLAEPAFWINWKHVGQASSAGNNCEMVSLHCETAIKILSQDASAISGARRYAKTFAAYFDKQFDRLSDVWADIAVLEAMVSEAFIKHEKELLRHAVVSKVVKDTKTAGLLTRMTSRLPSGVSMASRLSGGNTSQESRVAQDEQKNWNLILQERVRKYGTDGRKREILGIRRMDSDSNDDDDDEVLAPVVAPVSRNPERHPSIGRGTFLNGLNVVPGIASVFRARDRLRSFCDSPGHL
ncbi:unnamed protein product [Polarella glacialis]|uniref:Ion transport domain-containing protein n=1 Tax=Polarella glacialis TaxID=89957 RepID=A0A813KU75_POLGL|nr:unnamed protein product [Polarella glacialis]CAE8709497.1 unnamed protein product [Polarella glacialis]